MTDIGQTHTMFYISCVDIPFRKRENEQIDGQTDRQTDRKTDKDAQRTT